MNGESHAQRVADNVRVAMTRSRVSQTALAPRLPMSQQALSRRLLGQVSFTVDELGRVAEALNVSVTDLMSAGPDSAPRPEAASV